MEGMFLSMPSPPFLYRLLHCVIHGSIGRWVRVRVRLELMSMVTKLVFCALGRVCFECLNKVYVRLRKWIAHGG